MIEVVVVAHSAQTPAEQENTTTTTCWSEYGESWRSERLQVGAIYPTQPFVHADLYLCPEDSEYETKYNILESMNSYCVREMSFLVSPLHCTSSPNGEGQGIYLEIGLPYRHSPHLSIARTVMPTIAMCAMYLQVNYKKTRG